MSPTGRSTAPRLESAYETEAAAITATRIPRASLLFILAIAGTGLVEYLYRPELLPLWAKIFTAEVLTLAPPLIFRKHLVRRRIFEPIILVSWTSVILLMTLYALAAPLSPQAVGYAMICIMTGASLLAWWKTTWQAVLVAVCCLTISGFVVFRGDGGIETTLMLFSTFAGGLISIFGNHYFEIHRRAILSEAMRSDDEASITSSLEAFAKRLNRGLSDEGVEDRVAALARSAMKADWALVLVKDSSANSMQVAGGSGKFPTSLDNLKAIDFPIGGLPFLRNTDQDVQTVEDWSSQMSGLINAEWDSDVLLATLHQHEDRIGLILVGFGDASRRAPRLLSGIAQHAGIAIANSRLMDQLRRASAMKSEFLATMSHELRTPLHVIMGYTEMLGDMLDDRGDPEVQQILRRLQQNEKSLTDLIEGTLDAHRLEAGRNIVKQMKFESNALFEQIKLDTRWLPRTPGVQLKWELPNESVVMCTDPTKVKVIAKNLIGNALKFTKRGSVRVSAQLDQSSKRIQIIVSDSGPGIPENEISHIFEMFRQATPSASESALSGVGLGLFIVREFASQLGGTVVVDNNQGGGARFVVELPLEIADAPNTTRLVA